MNQQCQHKACFADTGLRSGTSQSFRMRNTGFRQNRRRRIQGRHPTLPISHGTATLSEPET